jgi:3-phenylpropionate/cinnamic acid dioxygenase small subunit
MDDTTAIANLVAALAHHADGGEVSDYVALFTEDAVWEMPANPATGLAASVRTGRAEIEAGVHERRAAGVQGPGSRTMHVISTIRIDIVEDRATAHLYWQFYGDTTNGGVLRSMGRYDDEYAKTAGGWKLARRVVTIG